MDSGTPALAGGRIVAAVVVAEVAVVLLRPRDGVIEPAPVRARIVLQRLRDRARARLPPAAAGALRRRARRSRSALLALLVARPPRAPARPVPAPAAGRRGRRRGALGRRLGRRPAAEGRRARARARTSASSRSPGAATRATSRVLVGDRRGSSPALGGGGGGRRSMRRFPRGWWVPGSAVVVAFGVASDLRRAGRARPALQHASSRCPPGQTRDDVLELARARRGRRRRGLRSTPAAARPPPTPTSPASGTTKRVVLYDTLLENFTRDEVRLVVAHELAPRPPPRRAQRPALPRDRRAVRAARGRAPDRAASRRGERPGPARRCCPRSRSASSS